MICFFFPVLLLVSVLFDCGDISLSDEATGVVTDKAATTYEMGRDGRETISTLKRLQ